MGTNENGEVKKGRVVDSMHPEVDKTGVQVGGEKNQRLPRKLILLLGLLVVVIGVGAGLALHRASSKSADNENMVSPTQQQDLNNTIRKLKKNPPANGASIETKNAYYDNLVQVYEIAGDYKNAISTYKTREALSTKGLTYQSYTKLALYYHKVGNQTEAGHALDTAVTLAPKAGDPETGDNYDQILAGIAATRKELGL